MLPHHKQILQRHLGELVDNLDPMAILPYLVDCLTPSMIEEIESASHGGMKRNGVHKLYMNIIRRPEGFQKLVAALRHPSIKLGNLADKLDPPSSSGTTGATGITPSPSKEKTTLQTDWNELPRSVTNILKQLDRPHHVAAGPDLLAEFLNLTNEDYEKLKDETRRDGNLTITMFKDWRAKQGHVSLRDIYEALNYMERRDLIVNIQRETGIQCPFEANSDDTNQAPVNDVKVDGASCVNRADDQSQPGSRIAAYNMAQPLPSLVLAPTPRPQNPADQPPQSDDVSYSVSDLPAPQWSKSPKSLFIESKSPGSKSLQAASVKDANADRQNSGEDGNDLEAENTKIQTEFNVNVPEEPESDTDNSEQPFENMNQTIPKGITDVRYAADMNEIIKVNKNDASSSGANSDKTLQTTNKDTDSSKSKAYEKSKLVMADTDNLKHSNKETTSTLMDSRESKFRYSGENDSNNVEPREPSNRSSTVAQSKDATTLYDRHSFVSAKVNAGNETSNEPDDNSLNTINTSHDFPTVREPSRRDGNEKQIPSQPEPSIRERNEIGKLCQNEPLPEINTDFVCNMSLGASESSLSSGAHASRTQAKGTYRDLLDYRQSALNDVNYSLEDDRKNRPPPINNSEELRSLERKSKKQWNFPDYNVECDSMASCEDESMSVASSINDAGPSESQDHIVDDIRPKEIDTPEIQANKTKNTTLNDTARDTHKSQANMTKARLGDTGYASGTHEIQADITRDTYFPEHYDSGNESLSSSRQSFLGAENTERKVVVSLPDGTKSINKVKKLQGNTDTNTTQGAGDRERGDGDGDEVNNDKPIRGELSHSLPYTNALHTDNGAAVIKQVQSLPVSSEHVQSGNSDESNDVARKTWGFGGIVSKVKSWLDLIE